MLGQLEARGIWVEAVDVRLAAGGDLGNQHYRVSVRPDVRKKPDEWSFLVRLAIALTPESGASARYIKIEIATAGIFELPPDAEESWARAFVPISCLAMLHGFARGVVAQLTGLNPGGPVLLPSVDFVEVLKEASAKRPKRKRKRPAAGPANATDDRQTGST